jgi:hypothetical protein
MRRRDAARRAAAISSLISGRRWAGSLMMMGSISNGDALNMRLVPYHVGDALAPMFDGVDAESAAMLINHDLIVIKFDVLIFSGNDLLAGGFVDKDDAELHEHAGYIGEDSAPL